MRRPVAWQRWLAAAGMAFALAVVAEWCRLLAHSIPPVARSDHLLAIWRVFPALEQGDWGEVLAWVFEFTGGHVIAYARALQVVNYLYFDYSGAFIRAAAIASFALTCAAASWAIVRTMGFGVATGLLLPWSAWLVCSPVLANVLTWPEGAPPFLAPTLVASLLVPWLASGGAAALLGGTVAMAFTNGSGLIFLPAAAAARLTRRQLALLAAGFGLLLAALLVLLHVVRAQGVFAARYLPAAMNLEFALRSMYAVMDHPGFFFQYALALLALPFAPYRLVETWPYGLAVAVYAALLLALTPHREPGPQRGWLVLAWFGVLATAVLALSRYAYVDPLQARDAVITTHYAAVVLPLFLALGPLTLLQLRTGPWWRRAAIGVLGAALAIALVHKRLPVERDLTAAARTELAIQFGSQNWSPFAAAVSLGAINVAQSALLDFYPELKARGVYPELTRDLVLDPAAIGVAGARRDAQACGAVHAFAPDTRQPWGDPLPSWALARYPARAVVPFTRAVGYVDCNADFVLMFGQDGAVQCVARPGPLATYFTEPELKARPGMGERSFDFSCPGGSAQSVWAFDSRQRVLRPVLAAP